MRVISNKQNNRYNICAPFLGAQCFSRGKKQKARRSSNGSEQLSKEQEEGNSMCGICGYTAHCESDEQVIKAMCDVIAHRGPDGEGRSVLNGAVFGHRRLSLIDLEGGGQPMFRNAEKSSPVFIAGARVEEERSARHSIVFNGEIYNYQDLRIELEQLGYAFSTTSDTEVLLLSYIVWGEAMLNRLRGMFAFAIWDAQEQELFCARDFFGIKPFYYAEDVQGHFIFASEAKSILGHPSYTKKLNHRALEDYLVFQFPANEETFFKGIYKLAPATYIRVKQGKIVEKKRYWEPRFEPVEGRSLEQLAQQIDNEFRESVRYHNVADVEVGSFLSSGIDSSYMAACLAKENKDIKTFTVGFAEYEGERDEISWAQELAEELKVENHSHHITKDEYWQALKKIQYFMDEPSGDPSAVALYFVDREAAKHVKAVLSGEGADEFFAGYAVYQAPLQSHKASWVPKPLLSVASSVFDHLGIRGANYLHRAALGPSSWYYTNANGVAFSEEERCRVLKQETDNATGAATYISPLEMVATTYKEAQERGYDDVQQMQHVDLYFWLVGDILLKTDKMSMAHSLESRVPFLDKGVFDVARHIPTADKVTSKQTKIPLRKASETAIPAKWAAKKKLGFPVPIVAWLREDEYAQRIRRAFTGEVAQEYFNTSELERILDEHIAGKDNSRKIWIIYMFLLWHEAYFDDPAEAEGESKAQPQTQA